MSDSEGTGTDIPTGTSGRPFPDVLDEARGALGDPPTLGDGPFARWQDAERWLTIRRLRTGETRVSSEPAAACADDEYRTFESLPLESLPYRWRVDDVKALPNGTYLPGVHEAESFDELSRRLPVVIRSYFEAAEAFAPLASQWEVFVWHDDPALRSLPRSERWSRRRSTSWSAITAGDRPRLTVQRRGDRMMANWDRFTLDAEGADASAQSLLDEIASWGAAGPHHLRHVASVQDRGRKWSGPLLGIGMEFAPLWS